MSNQQPCLVVPSTNFTPMNTARSPNTIYTEKVTREAVRTQILKIYPDLENQHPYLVDRLTDDRSRNRKALLKRKTTHLDPGTSCPNGSLCIKSHKDDKNELSSSWSQLGSRILECPAQDFPAELECPLCFCKIKLKKWFDWPSHIHSDLRTFSCTWDQCKHESFTKKANWIRHENEAHHHLEWWTCNVNQCAHTCYRKDKFLKHLSQRHDFHKPDTTQQKAEECYNRTQKKAEEKACKFCGYTFQNWERLFSHMAKHMEELALLLHFQYQIGQGEIAEGEGGNSVKAAMEAQNPTTVRRNPKTPAQAEQDRRTCQEPLREWSASKDAKVYGDQIYEHKSTGPFAGNFAAQGTLINIDGEDFVEYRVLMRPSFC